MRTVRPTPSRLAPRLALGLLVFALACGGDDDTDVVQPDVFRAIRLDPAAPPLCATSVTFVATKGQSASGEIDLPAGTLASRSKMASSTYVNAFLLTTCRW